MTQRSEYSNRARECVIWRHATMESALGPHTANGFEVPAMHAKKQARSQRSTTGDRWKHYAEGVRKLHLCR